MLSGTLPHRAARYYTRGVTEVVRATHGRAPGPGRVHGCGVGFDVTGRTLRAAGKQRPGVGQHERIVVDVDHPRFGSDSLGDLVGVVDGRQPGPDIEELADSGLALPRWPVTRQRE